VWVCISIHVRIVNRVASSTSSWCVDIVVCSLHDANLCTLYPALYTYHIAHAHLTAVLVLVLQQQQQQQQQQQPTCTEDTWALKLTSIYYNRSGRLS
jgi:hypothetical protein